MCIVVHRKRREAAGVAVIDLERWRDVYRSNRSRRWCRRTSSPHCRNSEQISGCMHSADQQRRCSSRRRALRVEVCDA
ncbi:MAG: hypothetical protein E5Y34_17950 [Mesorhizobium sp.]|nr:MAG: hypothetical protein E5Y34_17950 [Mesorhizobium sp.]